MLKVGIFKNNWPLYLKKSLERSKKIIDERYLNCSLSKKYRVKRSFVENSQ